MIERIAHNHTEFALIIRRSYRHEGIEFFTPSDYSQQVAYMNRPGGYVIAPVSYTHLDVYKRQHR